MISPIHFITSSTKYGSFDPYNAAVKQYKKLSQGEDPQFYHRMLGGCESTIDLADSVRSWLKNGHHVVVDQYSFAVLFELLTKILERDPSLERLHKLYEE